MDTIAVIRDIAIIVFAVVLSFLTLLLVFLSWRIYRKISPIINSARKASKTVEDVSSNVSEKLVKPLIARSVLALGAGQLLSFILGVAPKKEGGKKDG